MGKNIVSPDGLLELVVETKEGDVIVGFRGFPWHTHADILSKLYELDEEAAVDRFVTELTSGAASICILRKRGEIVDAWVTADPSREKAAEGEALEIRNWIA